MDTVFQSSLEWLSCAVGSVMKFSRSLHFNVGGRDPVAESPNHQFQRVSSSLMIFSWKFC